MYPPSYSGGYKNIYFVYNNYIELCYINLLLLLKRIMSKVPRWPPSSKHNNFYVLLVPGFKKEQKKIEFLTLGKWKRSRSDERIAKNVCIVLFLKFLSKIFYFFKSLKIFQSCFVFNAKVTSVVTQYQRIVNA